MYIFCCFYEHELLSLQAGPPMFFSPNKIPTSEFILRKFIKVSFCRNFPLWLVLYKLPPIQLQAPEWSCWFNYSTILPSGGEKVGRWNVCKHTVHIMIRDSMQRWGWSIMAEIGRGCIEMLLWMVSGEGGGAKHTCHAIYVCVVGGLFSFWVVSLGRWRLWKRYW